MILNWGYERAEQQEQIDYLFQAVTRKLENCLLEVSKCFRTRFHILLKRIAGILFLDFLGTFWTSIIPTAIKFPINLFFLYSSSSVQPVAHTSTAT